MQTKFGPLYCGLSIYPSQLCIIMMWIIAKLVTPQTTENNLDNMDDIHPVRICDITGHKGWLAISTSVAYIYIYGLLESHPLLFYSICGIIISEEENKLHPIASHKTIFLLNLTSDSGHHKRNIRVHISWILQRWLCLIHTHQILIAPPFITLGFV